MNYAAARQRQTDGRWDWTVRNDRRIWPAGYCAGWHYDQEGSLLPAAVIERERAQALPLKDRYHSDGHATKEEAERCHYAYELDRELRESTCSQDEQHRCQARWRETRPGWSIAFDAEGPIRCDQWTTHLMSVGLYLASRETWLCDAHRRREVFEALHPFVPGRVEAYS